MEFLCKNTYQSKYNILDNMLGDWYVDGEKKYTYLIDFDEEYVYFDIYHSDQGRYIVWKASYTYNGTTAVFGNDAVEVVRVSEYKVVEQIVEDDEPVTKGWLKTILKNFGGSNENKFNPEGAVVHKSLQEEQMISWEAAYVAAGEMDLQGDTYDVEGCKLFLKALQEGIENNTLKSNLFHGLDVTGKGVFSYNKAFMFEEDTYLDETFIPAYLPIVEVQWESKAAWEMRKNDHPDGLQLGGMSFGGMCETEVIDG